MRAIADFTHNIHIEVVPDDVIIKCEFILRNIYFGFHQMKCNYLFFVLFYNTVIIIILKEGVIFFFSSYIYVV